MTDSSMNFGPAWIRNLRSEGTTMTMTGSGGGTNNTRYQLAEYRYGREEMLALFDKFAKPPEPLSSFKTLYSEQTQIPLALLPTTEEEQRGWQSRPTSISGVSRGRGGSLERGGRINRGRGGYQAYGRATSAYDSGWGNGEQPDWSPRKEFSARSNLTDNWRRTRNMNDEDDGWRNMAANRSAHEKWGRSSSWRAGESDAEEKNGPPERGGRSTWQENSRTAPIRKSWDPEDNHPLPEWATENPGESGGTFDERGAFHGSDDEQDYKKERKRELLQKSTSQQHIPKRNNPSISTSKSTTSLSKSEDHNNFKEDPAEKDAKEEYFDTRPPTKDRSITNIPQNNDEKLVDKGERIVENLNLKLSENLPSNNVLQAPIMTSNIDKGDEEFDRLQEDLVLKLVVDEDTPKPPHQTGFDVTNIQSAPPNLIPPTQEKWYYQDPQGTRQGPFLYNEMAEWYKAGYFSNQLHVMRECDERYFLLGDLLSLCGGENPFLSEIRFPILKNETSKLPDDVLPYHVSSKLSFPQQTSMRTLAEPWSALTLPHELAAQRLLLQQHQQTPPDIQFLQQNNTANPLMFMINHLQQNKLPNTVITDKPGGGGGVPTSLDPLLVQMGTIHSLQNRLQNLNSGMPTNLSSTLPPEVLTNALSNLQATPLASIPPIHSNLPNTLPAAVNVNRPSSHGTIDSLPTNQDTESINNFFKQLQQQQHYQKAVDSLWQKQNQFNVSPPTNTQAQWQSQPEPISTPISMWDLKTPAASIPNEIPTSLPEKTVTLEKEIELPKPKEEISQKELKKRKELEEKIAKKEAEERRKQEQKKQEAEKKALEEKKKKEEDRIRKELEKAKKEAEDKRLRELEEKRRLKEQRKAEEELRKKAEELKKQEEEKLRREKEREKQIEASRISANQTNKSAAKAAPWSQPNALPLGLNLSEIQKAEKERRAHEAALQLQKQAQQEMQQQLEKQSGVQFNWAKKPVESRKVKSFAEIQAEEQERMAKVTAEARQVAQLKEKETPISSNSSNIWNGQSLSWANVSSSSQWSAHNTGGFWDEVATKSSTKPSAVSKSSSTSAIKQIPQQLQQSKSVKTKVKKEELQKPVNNNNNNQMKDEFTEWCYRALANIGAAVDIPTFAIFLSDIESGSEVHDYCKMYLGDSHATQQFVSTFLEKRRSFKPKNNAHKDDMCSPAPAITPSVQHNNEFQEVKGKNKKNKKSKMYKVDSQYLGFNVTSAPDRINVGDRDYGDNS